MNSTNKETEIITSRSISNEYMLDTSKSDETTPYSHYFISECLEYLIKHSTTNLENSSSLSTVHKPLDNLSAPMSEATHSDSNDVSPTQDISHTVKEILDLFKDEQEFIFSELTHRQYDIQDSTLSPFELNNRLNRTYNVLMNILKQNCNLLLSLLQQSQLLQLNKSGMFIPQMSSSQHSPISNMHDLDHITPHYTEEKSSEKCIEFIQQAYHLLDDSWNIAFHQLAPSTKSECEQHTPTEDNNYPSFQTHQLKHNFVGHHPINQEVDRHITSQMNQLPIELFDPYQVHSMNTICPLNTLDQLQGGTHSLSLQEPSGYPHSSTILIADSSPQMHIDSSSKEGLRQLRYNTYYEDIDQNVLFNSDIQTRELPKILPDQTILSNMLHKTDNVYSTMQPNTFFVHSLVNKPLSKSKTLVSSHELRTEIFSRTLDASCQTDLIQFPSTPIMNGNAIIQRQDTAYTMIIPPHSFIKTNDQTLSHSQHDTRQHHTLNNQTQVMIQAKTLLAFQRTHNKNSHLKQSSYTPSLKKTPHYPEASVKEKCSRTYHYTDTDIETLSNIINSNMMKPIQERSCICPTIAFKKICGVSVLC